MLTLRRVTMLEIDLPQPLEQIIDIAKVIPRSPFTQEVMPLTCTELPLTFLELREYPTLFPFHVARDLPQLVVITGMQFEDVRGVDHLVRQSRLRVNAASADHVLIARA